MRVSQEYYLKIADLIFGIRSHCRDVSLLIDKIYLPFLNEKPAKPDIDIAVHYGIPEKYSGGERFFIAETEVKLDDYQTIDYVWDIRRFGNEKGIVIALRENPYCVQQVLIIGENLHEWEIYLSSEVQCDAVDVMKHPAGALIIYYVMSARNGILLHASAVKTEKGAIVFPGFSGTGKTTMASLWVRDGHIINDDRIIIRKSEGRYYVYNTPLYKDEDSVKVPLKDVFLLKHGKENKANLLSGAKALTGLMAFCIQHDYSEERVNDLVNSLTEIISCTRVHSLEFVPDRSVLAYIRKLLANE